ncbi:hypothetical protein vseg_018544 [Gypsophila vaccaria]
MASFDIYHARSISLPSRPHPVAEQLDEQLSRLRSSQSASSSSSISHRVSDVRELYSCVDRLLQLPLSQQELSVDEVLDGSVRLLDSCSASRDALQLSKERLQDVQSALRRRGSGEHSITSEVVAYLNTRRAVKKAVKKTLKSLKPETELKKDDSHTTLLDVQAVTADTLASLLSYIAGSNKSGWSIVAKLIHKNTKTASNSGFDDVDATLNCLVCQKKNEINSSKMEELRRQMSILELEIQDLDEQLEGLFRNLVKTRASLLNIISY